MSFKQSKKYLGLVLIIAVAVSVIIAINTSSKSDEHEDTDRSTPTPSTIVSASPMPVQVVEHTPPSLSLIDIQFVSGNTCIWGSICKIMWSSIELPTSEKVSILLVDKTNNVFKQLNSSDVLLNADFYSWTVSSAIPAGDEYRIRICLIHPLFGAEDVECGESGRLTILPFKQPTGVPTIKLLSPNGGEIWQAGNVYSFRWTSTNAESISINLDNLDTGARYGTGFNKSINTTESLDPKSGIMNWQVRDINLPPGRYKAYMTAINGNLASYASSTYPFLIVSATTSPTISLASPQGNENWTMGNKATISYSYIGPDATFNFALYRENSTNRCFLGTNRTEGGQFVVDLNSKIYCGPGEYVSPGRYKAEIIALPDNTSLSSLKVTSSDYFTIGAVKK